MLIVDIGINGNNTKIDSDNSINKILFTINYNINCNNDIIIIHNNTKIILVEYFKIIIL